MDTICKTASLTLARLFVVILMPVTCYLASQSISYLVTASVLLNPPIIVFLIKYLHSFAITASRTRNKRDLLFRLYELWLLSVNGTLLVIFEYETIFSLEITITEANLLVIINVALVVSLISIVNVNNKPTTKRYLSLPTNNNYNDHNLRIGSTEILDNGHQHGQQDITVGYLEILYDWPSGNKQSYKYIICYSLFTLFYLFYSYLNLTYVCISGLSWFGTWLIIPMDCSDIYDEQRARLVFFAGLFAAQLACCGLVLLSVKIIFLDNRQ